ncbi:MAG: hypothetical protein GX434_01950 [Peptococcaceae bacterium]|nr:hypothetical protein [Peptococcaceae bacterium]
MKKIQDSHTLGIVSGLIGGIGMIIFDLISNKYGISKRSYAQAASGMWVASKKQANSKGGKILGIAMTLGLSSLGGVIMTNLLSKKGTDNLITKGIFYGATYGAITTALLSGFPTNKVKPKDATSNLSYVAAHILYGITTTQLISKLGDKTVLNKHPMDYISSKPFYEFNSSEQDQKVQSYTH